MAMKCRSSETTRPRKSSDDPRGDTTGVLISRTSRKMKSLVLLILLLAVIPTARGQQVGLIANTDGRKTISFDAQWRTIIDPYESGYYDSRYEPIANAYVQASI